MYVSHTLHHVQHCAMRTTCVVVFGSLFVAQIWDSWCLHFCSKNWHHKLFWFWLNFGQKCFKIDFKIVCGCGCVSAPKLFVPFSWSLNGLSLHSNLQFELHFSPETPNLFNTMKRVELNNDNAKYNETQWTKNKKHWPISLEMCAAGYLCVTWRVAAGWAINSLW